MADAPKRDYYEVLGISHAADARAIKNAFRQLAMKYHPDRSKAPKAEARLKEIAEAYAVLSDPKKRSEYDTRGFSGVADFSAEDLFGTIDFGDIFGDRDFGFGLCGSLFERLFRHGRGEAPPGQDIQVGLVVSLDSLLRESKQTVHYNCSIRCNRCKGSGAEPNTTSRPCPSCGGTGTKVVKRGGQQGQGSIFFQTITTCPDCGGSGIKIDNPCRECRGTGQTEKTESLRVTIPAGAGENMALRIAGRGMPSHDPNGQPGDLFVVVESRPDDRFTRHGADLWRNESLSVSDAALGTERKVPALAGTVTVSVPAGIQPGEMLRLKGKGLPIYGGSGHGDLILRIEARIPERLSPSEKALYQGLRKLERPRTKADSQGSGTTSPPDGKVH